MRINELTHSSTTVSEGWQDIAKLLPGAKGGLWGADAANKALDDEEEKIRQNALSAGKKRFVADLKSYVDGAVSSGLVDGRNATAIGKTAGHFVKRLLPNGVPSQMTKQMNQIIKNFAAEYVTNREKPFGTGGSAFKVMDAAIVAQDTPDEPRQSRQPRQKAAAPTTAATPAPAPVASTATVAPAPAPVAPTPAQTRQQKQAAAAAAAQSQMAASSTPAPAPVAPTPAQTRQQKQASAAQAAQAQMAAPAPTAPAAARDAGANVRAKLQAQRAAKGRVRESVEHSAIDSLLSEYTDTLERLTK